MANYAPQHTDEDQYMGQVYVPPPPPPLPEAPAMPEIGEVDDDVWDEESWGPEPGTPELEEIPAMPEIPKIPEEGPEPEDEPTEFERRETERDQEIRGIEGRVDELYQAAVATVQEIPVSNVSLIGGNDDGPQLPGMPFDQYQSQSEAPIEWAKVINGYTVSGANITIIEPEIQIGDQSPVSISSQTVTATADYQYVGIQYTWATEVLALWGLDATKPASDDNIYRTWLYQVRYDTSTSKITSIHRYNNFGSIKIPAAFGDEV